MFYHFLQCFLFAVFVILDNYFSVNLFAQTTNLKIYPDDTIYYSQSGHINVLSLKRFVDLERKHVQLWFKRCSCHESVQVLD